MSVINRNSGSAIFDTFTIALTKNMRVGQVCIVNGQVTSSDGLGAQYEVKANGSGGVQMSNGNELVILDGETLKPESVANIAGLTGTKDNSQALLKGWHPDSDVGGGTLYWDSAALKSTHNGGTIFSDTVPWTTTTADYLNAVGETDTGGAGVWVRLYEELSADYFGAKSGSVDDTASLLAAITTTEPVFLPRIYSVKSLAPINDTILFSNGFGGLRKLNGADSYMLQFVNNSYTLDFYNAVIDGNYTNQSAQNPNSDIRID